MGRQSRSYSLYFDILSNIFAIYEPLLRQRFLDELPGSLVCILSERTDCNLEAELTRVLLGASQEPLRSFMATARSQTCPLSKASTGSGILATYLRMEEDSDGDSNGFENMLINTLLNVPLNATNNFIASWNNFVDLTMPPIVSFVSDFMVTVLQTPMYFVKLALQLGIDLPSLDQREQCSQGDLKQLLMWGMVHNVNWSFGDSILDIFFAPEPPPCSYPGATQDCQTNPQFTRSARASAPLSVPLPVPSPGLVDPPHHDPALGTGTGTDTGSQGSSGPRSGRMLPPDSKAPSSLFSRGLPPDSEVPNSEFNHLFSPDSEVPNSVLNRVLNSSDVSHSMLADMDNEEIRKLMLQDMQNSIDNSSSSSSTDDDREHLLSCDRASLAHLNATLCEELLRGPPSSYPTPPRAGRSLKELLCVYENWVDQAFIDPTDISLCAENFQDEFVPGVCESAPVFAQVVNGGKNPWLWQYCFNASLDHMVAQYCDFDSWTVVTPSLVKLCWQHHRGRFEAKLCGFDHDFFSLIFSNPDNRWLRPNCTTQPPSPTDVGLGLPGSGGALVNEACRYYTWDVTSPSVVDLLSVCIQNDEMGFRVHVCGNSTFLNELLKNSAHRWVGDYCSTLPTAPGPTAPGGGGGGGGPGSQIPEAVGVPVWCNYDEWPKIVVDPSVVGLCWQMDQLGFQKNVCCNLQLFDQLIVEPLNQWLMSVCADDQERVDILAQTCRYGDWSQPVIVDMTDLALCADKDAENFTKMVCMNQVVLQNLLANLDNTWLLQHCANDSAGIEGLEGIDPAQHCHYGSWGTALPDPFLLAFCWDYDQANFVGSICTNVAILSLLRQESSSAWVGTLCATYSGGGTGNGNGGTATTTTTTTSSYASPPKRPCPVREVVQRLNWTCSADFAVVCRPAASERQALQMLVRCGLEVLQSRIDPLLTQTGASVLGQASSLTVVLLVALEESKMTGLRVTDNILLSVLEGINRYTETEKNFQNKRVLLQCFSKVLTRLAMQQFRDVTSDTSSLIKEYFSIPLDSQWAVLRDMDTTTIRTILQYFNGNRHKLQLSEEYLQNMVSVFFQVHLPRDPSLFPDLLPLFSMASPQDILALPDMQHNPNVISTINALLPSLSMDRRVAFGRWYSRGVSRANLTEAQGGLSIIRDTGHLIAYLPFQHFQHFSPAQLLDGLDVLLDSSLSSLKQHFIAQSVAGSFRNLTAQQFESLGNLTCLADPEDLKLYANTEAFTAIQENIRKCAAQGQQLPSSMVSGLMLTPSQLSSPSSLSAESLAQLSPFLPQMGTDFLSKLNPSQLNAALPNLASVPFSPAQAAVIVNKLAASGSLSEPGRLSALGSLVSGVQVETLWRIPPDSLLASLPNISLQSRPGLTAPQQNTITTKLWGSPEVTKWLDKLEALLPVTPLLSLHIRRGQLIANITTTCNKTWNTQQAIALFEAMEKDRGKQRRGAMSIQDFIALGTIGPGVSCLAMRRLFQSPPSLAAVKEVLLFLRTQPVALHTSVKNCLIDELYQLDLYSEVIGELGAQIALSLPVSTIKKFTLDMMKALRQMILEEPQYFMMLPTNKKLLVVDKMLQRLSMYTGVYTKEEFRSLGVMATYVADEILVQVDRQFLLDNMEMVEKMCYEHTKPGLLAHMLQENSTFGPAQYWTPQVLIQVGRLFFFLPRETIQLIPSAMMTQERIERLFMRQREWEESESGTLCLRSMGEQAAKDLFSKQQFVLQNFLGFLRPTPQPPMLVPSCESLHVTRPSAWTLDSLKGMAADDFSRCLELMGQDPYLSTYQLKILLDKVKLLYGPASSFSPSLISQLGRLSSQFSLTEMAHLNLSETRAVAALGALSTWNSKQMPVLFQSVLNSTRSTPTDLLSSSLVALGYVICGIDHATMRQLNAVEFSKAVLWLGRLRLACSEEQQRAMVVLLSHSLAFGPISSWGTDVFLEVGSIAVGLLDMEMSSLIGEQIQGLTPLAISLIPPEKFAVVFRPVQISMFSYEQAVAVTKAQYVAMTPEQQTALSMVINPWENKPVDFRGRSSGVCVVPYPLCHLATVLTLLWLHLLFSPPT
ncbi:stereocilin [Engraulis encrasicolus]|uniref:stereocilin n=1 Tax=Engraulis encrasicolus TaxID=184585 RepID=UPI002FD0ECFF